MVFPNMGGLANMGVHELKVKDATLAELTPRERKPRPLTPRQLAIRKRELVIGNALRELVDAKSALIKRVELEDGEKLPTIRAAIARQIKSESWDVQLVVRNGDIYLWRGLVAPR